MACSVNQLATHHHTRHPLHTNQTQWRSRGKPRASRMLSPSRAAARSPTAIPAGKGEAPANNSHNSYNRYLAIAARVVRRSQKEDLRVQAERRGEMDLRFATWSVRMLRGRWRRLARMRAMEMEGADDRGVVTDMSRSTRRMESRAKSRTWPTRTLPPWPRAPPAARRKCCWGEGGRRGRGRGVGRGQTGNTPGPGGARRGRVGDSA